MSELGFPPGRDGRLAAGTRRGDLAAAIEEIASLADELKQQNG